MATLPSQSYNVDKLNFSSIKKEISNVPKIIRKKSQLGFRSNTSMHNDSFGGEKKLMSLTPSRSHKKNLSQDTNSYPAMMSNTTPETYSGFENNLGKNSNIYTNNIARNFKEKINLMKIEHKKALDLLAKENQDYVKNLTDSYEQRLKDLKGFYELKYERYEKSLKDNLNDFKNLAANYININKHKEIINFLNAQWTKKFSLMKKEYENYINNLTNILKIKDKYRGLLTRLLMYKKNNISIEKIEEVLNPKRENFSQVEDIMKLSQLTEEVNYYAAIFEMKLIYHDKMNKIKSDTETKLDNLVQIINNKFDFFNTQNIIKENPKDPNEEPESKIKIDSNFEIKGNTTSLKIQNERYEIKNDTDENEQQIQFSIGNNSLPKSPDVSSMDLETVNFDDSFPNKPTNVLVVNDIFKESPNDL